MAVEKSCLRKIWWTPQDLHGCYESLVDKTSSTGYCYVFIPPGHGPAYMVDEVCRYRLKKIVDGRLFCEQELDDAAANCEQDNDNLRS